MNTIICLAVFTACLCSFIRADSASDAVVKAFTANEVDKDMIKPAPPKKLEVYYPKTKQSVNLGNELFPKNVREQPTVTYEADPKAFYTISMSDPDAPSRKNPARREWQHWLVVNIPGSDLTKGETLNEYVGAAPPKDSGLHRYVILLFKQPRRITFTETKHLKTDGNRANFSIRKFADKYSLGNPIAGNFYQAKFDDSVLETHKQFRI